MKRAARSVALALAFGLALTGSNAFAAGKPDPLSKMFAWWDNAFAKPDGYTPDAFRKYFTEDAVLMIDGKVVARGVDEWAAHFQKIQAAGGSVEIVLPFRETFRAGDKIFTYHMIRSVRDGVLSCQLAAGYAMVRDGKLALVSLVRAPVDPAKGRTDPPCEAPRP